jgi:hypothetical protein
MNDPKFLYAKGTRSNCMLCSRPIVFTGDCWVHSTSKQRHAALPGADALCLVNEQPAGDEIRLRAAASDEISLCAIGEAAELVFEAANADGPAKLPTFDMLAYTGGPIRPSGWYNDEPIIIDIESMNIRPKVPIDVGHGTDIGHTTAVEKTPGNSRLKAKGVLSCFDPTSDDEEAVLCRTVIRKSKADFPFGASVDVSALRSKIEYIAAGQTVKVNGKTWPGPVSVARGATLKKIAVLSQTTAADSNTTTNIAAQQRSDKMDPEFVKWLKAQGLPEAPAAEQLVGLQAAWTASKTKPAPTIPVATPVDLTAQAQASLEEDRRVKAKERNRVDAIEKLCGKPEYLNLVMQHEGKEVSIKSHALDTGLSEAETALHCVRNARPKGPHGITHSEKDECTTDVLCAALMLRVGAKLDHKAFKTPQALSLWGRDKDDNSRMPAWLRADLNDPGRNKVMDRAHKYASLSAMDILRVFCQASGREAPWGREQLFQAAFSGGALTHIFTDSINARLVQAYDEADSTIEGWTQPVEVADFKINTDIRLTTGGNLTLHPRGGTADHQTRADVGEGYRAYRFSTQFQVDEQDFIDDHFGAISEMPVQMGRGARRIPQDFGYSILLANPNLDATGRALFNNTDGNVGTGAALSETTLKAAITRITLRQENGINLNLKPTHIVVPPTLEFTTDELIHSAQLIIAGTAGSVTTRGSENQLRTRNLIRVSDARLENGCPNPLTGVLQAGSSSQWYVACAEARTILIATLRGTGGMPIVRGFQLDKGQWGMGWDIKHDVGAKARDWRGLDRSTA